MKPYVAAIDQGTTSTRFIIFNRQGQIVSFDQKEHEQIYPGPGRVEHDPDEIWERTQSVIRSALQKGNIAASEIAAVGITNQRETTVVWDRTTGRPYYNAIVWQDTRTDQICNRLAAEGENRYEHGPGQDRFRATTGLPLSTYFAGPKLMWLLEHVEGLRTAAEAGQAIAGTIDTFLLWHLTGGPDGGVHMTDVTNASRTMLMDLESREWEQRILDTMDIPRAMLPHIQPSSYVYGEARGVLAGVPIAGILGDQQAALMGQTCYDVGEAKNTYGTGCFMLLNTGTDIVHSNHGLVTTVAYQLGEAAAIYALEGSIAITGALVQWLRDNMGMITSSAEVEALANTVKDNGGIYFVPAFSGLFAPYWRSNARGAIVGLTRYVTRGHLARATLEATAYQTREILDAMEQDSGINLASLKVDGGMVYNQTLMQFQADILGVPVVRPTVAETTSLGAAYAAGLATGFWNDLQDLRQNWSIDTTWQPAMDEDERTRLYAGWKKAVTRTFDWVDD
jgi:glycerol kinase